MYTNWIPDRGNDFIIKCTKVGLDLAQVTSVLQDRTILWDPLSDWGSSSSISRAVPRVGLMRCGAQLGRKKKEMFYLTTHSTHFIYGYMASDIW